MALWRQRVTSGGNRLVPAVLAAVDAGIFRRSSGMEELVERGVHKWNEDLNVLIGRHS
jgi:hypothetical protein